MIDMDKNSDSIPYLPAPKAGDYQKYQNWSTAIGLQAVDGLKPSRYLLKLAEDNIKGKKSIEEVEALLGSYYEGLGEKERFEKRYEQEADKVSSRIAKLLETKSFVLTEMSLRSIHRILFAGWPQYTPGRYRTYDIVKKEWVLDGDTVQYGHWRVLDEEVKNLIDTEKNFNYSELSISEKIEHITNFVSDIWVLHAFFEGNTRTTAVFTIKYLNSIGFKVDNTPFEAHSLYFRNALVRANYENGVTDIQPDKRFLVRFFENLLNNGKYVLRNREMHIYWRRGDTVNNTVDDTVDDTVKIINLIKRNKDITIDEIAKKLRISRSTVLRRIKVLKERGSVRRVGTDKAGYWEATL
ncbi:cell filamentation protein Fic [Alphaproteobacteria bacterium]|nr:cell filamentation protein Fic [Alphaproteobacteria bacterium]